MNNVFQHPKNGRVYKTVKKVCDAVVSQKANKDELLVNREKK